MAREERVFLSYAHENLETIQKLHSDLIKRDVNVWFDKVDLGPGKWKPQIRKAIARSSYFIICISEAALRKTGDEPGFQDEELNDAYHIATAQSESEFTIIPLRLEDCDRGDHRLSIYQQYDLFEDWDSVLDVLAVQLGGRSLTDSQAKDERTEEQKLIERVNGKAITLYYGGEYEKAIGTYDVVEAIQDASIGFNKGVALEKLGRYKEALETLDQALSLRPDDAVAWSNKGILLENQGRYEEALEALDQALVLQPDLALAWSNKGLVFEKLGRYEKALTAFDQALAFQPDDARVWSNKGLALGRLRNEQKITYKAFG